MGANTISLADGAPGVGTWPAARDLLRLTKPRLSLLVFCTTGMGLYSAPERLGALRGLVTLLSTALLVAAANAYNSFLERHIDARMLRTRGRPLPQGRIEPGFALRASLAAALVAVLLLYVAAGPWATLLGFAAFASYAWLYTPMKQISWLAVWLGAVPGALPPLLGTAAAQQRLSLGGLSLFLLLYVWQLPHFFAIALRLSDDYRRGGIVVLPHVIGDQASARWLFVSSLGLVPTSALPAVLGWTSMAWGVLAVLSSVAFAGLCMRGLWQAPSRALMGQIFLASVLHMAFLLLALCIDCSVLRGGLRPWGTP